MVVNWIFWGVLLEQNKHFEDVSFDREEQAAD